MEFDITNNEDDAFVKGDAKATGTTLLDSLREELKKSVKNRPIVLQVPGRPGMSIKFDANIEAEMLQNWRKACKNKSMPDQFDGLKFACIVVANQADEVIFKGEVIVDADGELLNFKNQRFIEMLDADRAVGAVRKLYGVDGHIFIAADEIVRAAGYDSEGQEQQTDPTLIS